MPETQPRITQLDRLVQDLPADERAVFQRIFHVSTTTGHLRVPPSMRDWIKGYFGSVEAVQSQRIVKVTNLITLDGALFNELRANRPMETVANADLEEIIMANVGDPFCNPLEGTPEDVFGRVRGRHSITASNVAKYDGFHGLVVFDEHNPLAFTREGVSDALDTALEWAKKAHNADQRARYFFFLWNCLWKSGASILHGHAQMTLSCDIHYAKIERWRRAAVLYRIAHGVNYFDDLYAAHRALGLTAEHGRTRALAYLTPVKEKETLLISERLDDDLKEAIYRTLHCFVNQLGVRSFNLALYWRPIDHVEEDWSGFPVVVRIVDRGDPNNKTADIGAMELYAASVIASDPFRVAEALRRALA